MNSSLCRAVEEWLGIKTEPDDVKKMQKYLVDTYGSDTPEILTKVFSSGEVAHFFTVHETYFFREPAHFALLRDLLPSFEGTEIQICSVAVASGCEAYSIAMLIEAYNKSAAHSVSYHPISYHIDAFDIDPKIIQTAREGVYGERSLREDGSDFRYMADPYLQRTKDGYEIKSSLKKNITFFVHNLMETLPPKEYDIVFFRNTFIYFLPEYRERILSNLSAVLKEGGILVMGVSETAGVQHERLESINRNDVFYFQKSFSTNMVRIF